MKAGSRIASRYTLLEEIGAGGMGVVFKAHDDTLDEVLALKLLRPEVAPGGKEEERRGALVSRFRSEVRLARKVRHRNVCGIHDYGEDGGVFYISMEYVDGHDLRRVLMQDGPLNWEAAYDTAMQLADGLAAIHEAGIIHRDLKPANIMLDSRQKVRLMDFGIAKALRAETGSGLTNTGSVVGSLEYMSPEQVRDWPLDARSDVYSLGVVLFELFTGRVPFRGDTPASTMLKHLQDEPPLRGPQAARIPEPMVPILERTLAKEPSSRYASCEELRSALAGASRLLDQPTPSFVSVPALPGRSAIARLLVPQLLKALRCPDAVVRREASETLATIDAERERVILALSDVRTTDVDPTVRNAATEALRRMGVPSPASTSVAESSTPPSPCASAAPDPALDLGR